MTNNVNILRKKKIIIIGSPGSGKSTMSKELSDILMIPVIHLDKIFWKPNWISINKEEFDQKLNEVLMKDTWIIDGDYNRTLGVRIKKCDLIIYLDYETEVSLNSYYKRVKDKSITTFITEGCIEKMDYSFIEIIKSYNNKNRINNYKLIIDSSKDYIIFKKREEKEKFMNELVKIIKK